MEEEVAEKEGGSDSESDDGVKGGTVLIGNIKDE
jgi:hypothetical protein